MKINKLIPSALLILTCVVTETSRAQIFAINGGTRISEYALDGSVINANLISLSPIASVAVLGTNLLVGTSGGVREYTQNGTLINASFITGITTPAAMTVAGTNIYVSNYGNGGIGNDSVGKYTLSGTPINASLITGITSPWGLAVAGTNLFVVNANVVGGVITGGGDSKVSQYTTSGALVNSNFVTGLWRAQAMDLSGTNLYINNNSNIWQVATSGNIVSKNLLNGANTAPSGLHITDNYLYTSSYYLGYIGQYLPSGALVKNNFISGISGPGDFAVVPNPGFSFLTNGLVAYYTFNGNANNTVGNLYIGTNYVGTNGYVYIGTNLNGYAFSVTNAMDRYGNANAAYGFDGLNGYVITSNAVPIAGNASRTISFWFQFAALRTSQMIYWGDLSVNGSLSGVTIDSGGNLILHGNYSDAYFGSNSLSPNVWHHACLIYNGDITTAIGYVDGHYVANNLAQGSKNVTAWNTPANSPLCIGRDNNFPVSVGNVWQTPFQGLIDDVRIYNRALLPAEVTQLYALEAGTPSVGIATYNNSPMVYYSAPGAPQVGGSGVNYTVQMATNLSSPAWVTVTNATVITGFQVPNAPANAFFRLQ